MDLGLRCFRAHRIPRPDLVCGHAQLTTRSRRTAAPPLNSSVSRHGSEAQHRKLDFCLASPGHSQLCARTGRKRRSCHTRHHKLFARPSRRVGRNHRAIVDALRACHRPLAIPSSKSIFQERNPRLGCCHHRGLIMRMGHVALRERRLAIRPSGRAYRAPLNSSVSWHGELHGLAEICAHLCFGVGLRIV